MVTKASNLIFMLKKNGFLLRVGNIFLKGVEKLK